MKTAPQIASPHQVLKGMKEIEYTVTNTAAARAHNIITTKYLVDIVDTPATKHKISSGKKGKMNIAVNKRLSFPLMRFCQAERVSSPTIQDTALLPHFLPTPKAISEPKTLPIKLYIAARNAPNS